MSADDRTRELLARENDELKSSIAALDAEARRYKGSLQEAERAAQLGNWDWDAVKDEITGSEEFYRLFDVAPEGLAKFSQFVQRLHPDDRKRVQQDVADALKQDRPYDTDYRVKLSDGGWRDLIARGRVFADAGGKAVRMVGTCLDITERKRAEAELRESERRYRTLAESLPHLVWTCQGDGPCDYLSPRWVDYTGVPEAEQLGYGWLEQLHPDDRERVVAEWSQGAPRGDVFDIEFRIRRADGMHRWFRTSAIPFRDDAGRVVKWFGSNTDINDLKRTHEALRSSEEHHRATLQSIGDAVISTDASGRITQINTVAETLTGWTEAEARGEPLANVFRIVNEESGGEVESLVERVLREGIVVGLANHTILMAKDGTSRPIADSGAPIRNANGETTGVVLVFRDQTEERAAQAALAAREAQFRATFEQAAVGIAHVGLDGSWLRVNRRLCEIVGYTSEELLQKTFQDITHPDDLDTDISYVRQVVAGEIQTYSMEKRYIRKDRSLVWINLTVGSVRDDSGALKYFVSVVEDISARKRAQEELDVSQQRLSSMINAITESAFLMDPKGTILLANGSVAERLSTTPAAMVGRSVFDLLPFELAQARRQRIAEVIQSRAAVQFEDCRGERHILNSIYPVFDSENTVRQLAVFGYDITERKRAEEALRESEERSRATLYSIGDAVIATDAQSRITRMNPVAEHLTGWTEADAENKPLDEVFRIVNEETRALVESPVTRVLREGQIVGLANHTLLIAKDGKERPIADSGAPIGNANGETTGVVLVFRDQTEERRADRELRVAAEQFRNFFDNAPIGKCMTAPDGKVLRANPAFGEMLGYSVEEMQDVSFATITHPDDLPETRECVRSLLAAERESWSIEKRFIAKEGRIVWTSVTTALQRDPGGNPLYLLTHIQDITERKRAEKLILEQYATLRAILLTTDASVFSLDREYRYTTFNDVHAATMKALYGVDIQIGASLAEYQAVPEDWQVARNNLDRVLQGETFVESAFSGDEVRCRRYFEISHSPIRANANEIIGVSVYSRDITERKRAEDEIRQLNADLEQRVRDRTAQLEESNKELEAFSYSVSHDLRAPLRAIDGFTRILTDDYASHLDTEGKRLCSVIHDNAVKMSRLIDDLLAFSRLGRAEMKLSSIDMGTMANSVFHELTTPESRARIEFQVGTVPKAFADTTLMRQVWMNLLSNAIKFSSKRERATIQVSVEQIQGETVYAIHDNGAGFDMQYVHKLFGVFQRLHSTTEFEGTGVGLALVQRVIRRHGGRVWAKGEVDKGATLYFSLQHGGA